MKVLIIGVGNCGTSILGTLVNELLRENGFNDYWYEPLYWKGNRGKKGTVIDEDAINEHCAFPLLPDNCTNINWPWMESFIDELNGMAKFIRAGSRIKTFINIPNIKIIWITRNLRDFLASQHWHHAPPGYDDYPRMMKVLKLKEIGEKHKDRMLMEAYWWAIHNAAPMGFVDRDNLLPVMFESLCENPKKNMQEIAEFIGLKYQETKSLKMVKVPRKKALKLDEETTKRIFNSWCGEINDLIYDEIKYYTRHYPVATGE